MTTGTNTKQSVTKAPPNWAVNIRNYRKALNYTQQSFGAKFQVSAMAVSYWESGKRQPPLEVCLWLIKADSEAFNRNKRLTDHYIALFTSTPPEVL